MIKDILEDNIILVVPTSIKSNILKEISDMDEIHNIKIMSLENLINSFIYSYDEKSIYYLIKNHNMNIDVARMYLDNIKYVQDKEYKSGKLNKLNEIKYELLENNLLIYDKNIRELIKNKKIVIYGYDYISKFDMDVLDKIKEVTNVIIKEKVYKNYTHDIYEFKNIEEEVSFVASSICDLINAGIDIKKIKLMGYSSEYKNVINRIFSFYNIPINIKNENSIISSNIVQCFLNLLNDYALDETFKKITKKYNIKDPNNLYIYDEIIKLINRYNFIDEKDILISILTNELMKIKFKTILKENAVSVIDMKNSIFSDDDYVFLIGFNMGNIPYIHKDEEYITDNLCDKIIKEKSYEKNIIEKKIIIDKINSIKNLIITYKLKNNFEDFIPSSLIEYLNYNVIKQDEKNYKYSNILNTLSLAKSLDNLIKYGKRDKDIDLLFNNYNDVPYLKFNNKFKGINKLKFNESLKNELVLSYSSIDNYNRCAFRYYLNNILKLTEFTTSFAQMIGSMFHYILSKAFSDGFDFDHEYEKYIKDIELTSRDKFFIYNLKEELLFVIDTINKQNKFNILDKSLYENKVYVNKEGTVKLSFIGIIDKILYKEENDITYLVIIDYKTGYPHINLNNTIYGIDMQLPVYLYLSDKGLFNNAVVIGFYLQKILNNEIVRKNGKTYESQKKDNLKLQGYTNSNEELISKFDFTYKDSEVIKSLKIGNNGFYAYSKVITEEKIRKLIDIVEENINKAFNNILDAKFDINPKRIGKKLIGCEFCNYKDICYMTEEDVVNLEEYKKLDFLN